MASYKTKAIILSRLNLGESDRILTLFSPAKGKIRAIAKGSRKTKSKFSGHTELFTLCDFIISTGKNLDIITDSELISNFLAAKPDMENVKTAYFMAEVINKLLPDEQPNEDIYNLFLWCLESLNSDRINLIRLIFVARILKILGIYPELSKCVKCEIKPDPETLYFSKEAGGITDKGCSLHFPDAIKVNSDMIKLWRYLADSNFSELQKIKPSAILVSTVSDLALEYLKCVTLIDYRSIRVLS
jgi:DNA repair protein RecO (recombination protein O)